MAYRFPLSKIREAFERAKKEENPGGWPDAAVIAYINAIQLKTDRERAFWTAVKHYAANPERYSGKTMTVADAEIIPPALPADRAPF